MKQANLIAGLGFGDEGKGTITDYLVRRTGAKLVIRYNGGAQAGHNVVTPDGRHHCFAQFGAGTFAGARTFLGPKMMVDPLALNVEALVLKKTLGANPRPVFIDPRAPILTPWHKAVNRIKELARGAARHGSCGMGIGELAEDILTGKPVIRAADLFFPAKLTKLASEAMKEQLHKLEGYGSLDAGNLELLSVAPAVWAERVRREAWPWIVLADPNDASMNRVCADSTVVFEGAQGVLLDEKYGFQPHTTWNDCTFTQASNILAEMAYTGPSSRVGVLRTFATRHGAGPLPSACIPIWPWREGEHNATGQWQGAFRYGYFDAVLSRYALDVCHGVDTIALTHTDKIKTDNWNWRCVSEYHDKASGAEIRDLQIVPAPVADDFQRWAPLFSRGYKAGGCVEGVEEQLGFPVGIVSAGPTFEHKTTIPEHCPWEEMEQTA